ncbi:aconitase family protein, partial [Klebsiella pneumoniae]
VAYYDGCVHVDLSAIKPMIALPFHPSNVYTIDALNDNLTDILHSVDQEAKQIAGEQIPFSLLKHVENGKLRVQQGIIAGCAGGNYSNVYAAAQMLRG